MPELTLKKSAVAAINGYRKSRHRLINPSHFKTASELLNRIHACKSDSDIIDKIYEAYTKLISQRSKRMAKALGLFLATAWTKDFNDEKEASRFLTKVKTYHEHLSDITLIPYSNFAKYWGIELPLPKYTIDPLSDARIVHDQNELLLSLLAMECTREECNGTGARVEENDQVLVTLSQTYAQNEKIQFHVIYDVMIPNPVKQEYNRRNIPMQSMGATRTVEERLNANDCFVGQSFKIG